MSSSGKGQSLVKSAEEVPAAFEYGMAGSRGDVQELIVEEFVNFDYEITLLTVTQDNGNTLFCPPIGQCKKAVTTVRASNLWLWSHSIWKKPNAWQKR